LCVKKKKLASVLVAEEMKQNLRAAVYIIFRNELKSKENQIRNRTTNM